MLNGSTSCPSTFARLPLKSHERGRVRHDNTAWMALDPINRMIRAERMAYPMGGVGKVPSRLGACRRAS